MELTLLSTGIFALTGYKALVPYTVTSFIKLKVLYHIPPTVKTVLRFFRPALKRRGYQTTYLMFLTILMMYWLFLRYWIDANFVREKLAQVGNINRQEFVFGGAYFILINALIEEYFWRWFIYSRWSQLVDGKLAVLLSALSFTLHHAIGLAAFTDWRVVTASSLAVFIAGIVWSEYYRRYRSIWGNYFSHAIADLALHIIAWQIFFR